MVSEVTVGHADPKGLYRGASHLAALLLLAPSPLHSIYSVFGTSCMALKVKMQKQPTLLGWRRQRSLSKQPAALVRRVGWIPSRNLQCSWVPGHGGLVSQIA